MPPWLALHPQRKKLDVPSWMTMALGAMLAGLAMVGILFTATDIGWRLWLAVVSIIWPGDSPLDSPGMVRGVCAWLVFTGALLVLGGKNLRNGSSMGFAVATCVLLALPCCTSSLVCIGLPLGIWVFATLNDVEVRSSFG